MTSAVKHCPTYYLAASRTERSEYDLSDLLSLALLMALVLGADYHNLAVSFDDFALIAHRLN